jgi:hypothetical protein
MVALYKYPRTQHIQGSRLGPGDEDLDQAPFSQIAGRNLVIEEKIDGANAGICFDVDGQLWLQSRGHFLSGGARERQFNLFKQWASTYAAELYLALEDRYVLYGEWLYAKHTVFYDQLPHYFHEFDILDTLTGTFLSTPCRRQLLAGLPIVSVPVLHEGPVRALDDMLAFIGHSHYKGPNWRDRLRREALAAGLDPEETARQTDPSDLMEGLYIKVEEKGLVVERYKYVRFDFLNTILDSGSHWMRRPILPNQLADGVDLFGGGT